MAAICRPWPEAQSVPAHHRAAAMMATTACRPCSPCSTTETRCIRTAETPEQCHTENNQEVPCDMTATSFRKPGLQHHTHTGSNKGAHHRLTKRLPLGGVDGRRLLRRRHRPAGPEQAVGAGPVAGAGRYRPPSGRRCAVFVRGTMPGQKGGGTNYAVSHYRMPIF